MGRPLVTQTGISARQALSLLSFQCLFYFLSLGVRFRRWGRLILPSNLCSSLREKLLLWVSAPALQRPQRRPHPAAARSPPRQRLFPIAFHLPFGLQSKPMLHGAVSSSLNRRKAPASPRPRQSRTGSCAVRIFGEVLPAAAPGLFLADQSSEWSFPPFRFAADQCPDPAWKSNSGMEPMAQRAVTGLSLHTRRGADAVKALAPTAQRGNPPAPGLLVGTAEVLTQLLWGML